MKIISKYKDFYDYLTQDHDADLVYDRKLTFISENILNKFIDKLKYKDKIYLPWNKYEFYVKLDYLYFGIYPTIYLAPYFRIKVNPYERTQYNIDEYKYVFINEEIINSFKTRNDILQFVQQYTTLKLKDSDLPHFGSYLFNRNEKDISKYIKENYTGKFECKNVFKYINCPVFCEYNTSILDTDIYTFELEELRKTDIQKYNNLKYIGNCCFNKLNKDILKYWVNELININTYINIENFLWSIKQEPISNPDNKTKILSHGFDLKTSFRNVK